MPEAFHFLNPDWLWALLPLPLLLWGLGRRDGDLAAWRGVIQPHLLPHLVSGAGGRSALSLVLLALGWVLAVLALADPTWERQPTPLLKSRDARVVVLDLSQSMTTPDLPPSRLARARFKVADILARNRDGQSALVAFAGDAFVVSPLTEDGATIAALLAALEPGIMPVQGSRADLGLKKAGELLVQAGLKEGEVLLIADEADGRAETAARALREGGFRVSVLGVGTAEGAPLPDGRGGFISGADGKPVVVTLGEEPLRALAEAGGGRYARIGAGDEDLERLLPPAGSRLSREAETTDLEGERWQEQGPLLALPLLPLAALAFRRGWLVVLAAFTLGGLGVPDPARAFGWDDLWQRPDQQAAAALRAGDAARAAQLARDPMQQGAALYRGGDLPQALERFRQGDSGDAHYNRGNALAKLGQYPEAISAYEEALARQPDMDDAAYNKAQVEALLKKRQEQPQPQQGQQGQSQPSGKQSAEASGQPGDQKQTQAGGDPSQSSQPSQADAGKAEGQPGSSEGQQGEPSQPRSAENQPGQTSTEGQDQPAGAPDASRPESREPQQTTGARGGQQDPAGDQANPAGTAAASESKGEDSHSATSRQAAQAEGKAESESGAEPHDGKPVDGKASGDSGQARTLAEAEPLDSEQRQAIDQWLRRIPDDPGGLLRRKFLYQYRERAPQAAARGERPW